MDLTDLQFGFFCLIVLIIITLLLSIPITTNIERGVVNKTYGTNYSFIEFCSAGDLIKDNLLGKKQNIDLTLKGE